ncbi:uncharacterized protein LOC134854457 [Symsagittifera roscoffensis]|uniref:uncharacterized protein LOC134854457 n=1 Tax=Symsagittifera roscoffensis TaxID=84072 RepID=UPI00307C6154
MPYDAWKNEVDIWKRLTDLPAKKLGLAVALSLSGRRREVAMEVGGESLESENGLKDLLEKLDSIFGKETVDQSYEMYTAFESISRSSASVIEHIADFERAYTKMKRFKMELPDSILACKLLHSCNLTSNERQLVLSASNELNFDTMKKSLRRIFSGSSSSTSGVQLKDEPAFVANEELNEESALISDRFQRRGRFRGRGQASYSFLRGVQKKGRNPVDKEGRVTTCTECGSRNHWFRNCPDRDSGKSVASMPAIASSTVPSSCDSGTDTQVYLTFASNCGKLLRECYESAILDSGCTTTVAGDQWVKQYVSKLSKTQSDTVVYNKTGCRIVFGDGACQNAKYKAFLPAKFGSLSCFVSCDVIDGELPLLLSVKSMESAKFVLNFDGKFVAIQESDEKLDLKRTSTGHLLLNIHPGYEDVCLAVFAQSDFKKMHRQFGHCSAKRLEQLLKQSGYKSATLQSDVESVVDECETCKKFGRAKPKPSVSLPLAVKFNQVVSMDLHKLSELGPNTHYLHLIDLFTRFSVACIIHNKLPETIISAVLRNWCLVFGPPGTFMSDRGGEFNNERFLSMTECYNIRVISSASYSPWSNGVVERHNAIVTEAFWKTRSSGESTDDNLCLQFAVHAKNCLSNASGFTPFQLVFGSSPNLPNVIEDRDPALECVTTSEYAREHLNLLHKSRQAYIECESSNRIKRALRTNVRSSEEVQPSDQVFYKRSENQWRGPATVVNRLGSEIVVKHGGQLISVHPTRVRKCQSDSIETLTTAAHPENRTEIPLVIGSESTKVDTRTCPSTAVESDEEEYNVAEDRIPPEESVEQVNNHAQNGMKKQFQTQEREDYPKVRDFVKFVPRCDPEKSYEGLVISRAGKATGKYKGCFNVEFTAPDNVAGMTGNIDFTKDMVTWEKLDECHALIAGHQPDQFVAEKQIELENWIKRSVYTEVQDVGQYFIDLRWVCSQKTTGAKKARLVAKGFQDMDLETLVKDSPTCAREAFRLVLTVSASKNWPVGVLDISTAFLQGSELKREVYVKPPPEAESKCLWKLHKPVYGLADASRLWYDRVRKELLSLSCQVSQFDSCLFIWRDPQNNVSGVLCVHVDDFAYSGTVGFKNEVIDKISMIFDVGKQSDLPCSYLGVQLDREERGILIQQQKYIQAIEEIDVPSDATRTEFLSRKGVRDLRKLLGKLNWVSSNTRPDISFEVSLLISKLPASTVEQVLAANKVVRKLKYDNYGTCMTSLGDDIESWRIIVFTDASLNNLAGGATQGGYLVFLANTKNSRCSLISYRSQKIKRVVRSTLAAEALACSDGVDAAYLMQKMLHEIVGKIVPIDVYTDNRSLVDATYSTKAVADRRLRVEIGYLRDLTSDTSISLRWISTNQQVADCLTKDSRVSRTTLIRCIQHSSIDFIQ